MNLPLKTWGKTQPDEGHAPFNVERSLTLVIEGAARNMPEIEPDSYRTFRGNLSRLALKIPDHLPEEAQLDLLRSVLREFEAYRANADKALKDRLTGWRFLTARLLRELLGSMGLDASSDSSAPLVAAVPKLETAEQIRSLQNALDDFLRPRGKDAASNDESQLRVANWSINNLNAAGLPGGGAALERLGRLMNEGVPGFVVVFQLGCMEVIFQRFGAEAVQDSLMRVAAYLTENLHSQDAIYHWSDSSLVAILRARSNEQILNAELHRIISRSRDFTIAINNRPVMLRVPIEFTVFRIGDLKEPSDLSKLAQTDATR